MRTRAGNRTGALTTGMLEAATRRARSVRKREPSAREDVDGWACSRPRARHAKEVVVAANGYNRRPDTAIKARACRWRETHRHEELPEAADR